MPIYFCGDVTIDNYEFYGEFDPLSEKRERTPNQNSDWQAPKKIMSANSAGRTCWRDSRASLGHFCSVQTTNLDAKWERSSLGRISGIAI
jgi:hypothetical protein